jgi:hypothetical protein
VNEEEKYAAMITVGVTVYYYGIIDKYHLLTKDVAESP